MSVSRSSSSSSSSSLVAPSTSQTYIRSGIGGAGNWKRAASIPSALPVPQITTPRHGSFSSGVGGAGNIHSTSTRRGLSADEELAREHAIKRSARSGWHTGIGGAGNYVAKKSAPPVVLEPSLSSFSNAPLPVNGLEVLRRRLSSVIASWPLSRSRKSLLDDSSDGKSLVSVVR